MTPAPDLRRAAVWMSGAVTCFCLPAIAGRAAGQAHDTFEIMLYRSMIGLALVLAFARGPGQWGDIRRGPLHLHAARNISHFAGQNLWFHALTVAPLAQVFALEFTAPVWVLLLSPFLLGERITRRGALAALLGFAGILIVARPGATLSPGLPAASGVRAAQRLVLRP